MISSTFLYQKKKNPFAAKLSLVSLMDIFTILVFFLLLNSGESEKIENARFVELPSSTTGTTPHEELVVSIGKEQIWFQGEPVATITDVMKQPEEAIEGLSTALTAFKESKTELTSFEEQNGLSITIMGDKNVPYVLLKSVMSTSRLHDYRNISLAVNQVAPVGLQPATANEVASLKQDAVGG